MFNLVILKPKTIKNDILSGLTVSLALIPEAIAFSFVAHVDPTIGLYAAFIMGLITALFGGRPGMISGATGAIAVIFAPLVIQQTQQVGLSMATQYLFMAVILMGVWQLLFGLCRLGKFVRLIPYPVKLGFVNGLALVIFKAQLSQFYVGTGATAQLLPLPALATMMGLVALTMGISHFLPKLTKAVPATLVAIVVVTGLSIYLKSVGFHIYTVLDFVTQMDPAKTTIAVGLPSFSWPDIPFNWQTLRLILPFSLLAAAVGLIESLMTLTLIDELTATRGKGNQESMAQGVANILNGVFGGMGGCAMIGQSMINIRAGGRTRLSGMTAAVSLLGLVIFLAVWIEMIPLAALVGIMFMVVLATFEWSSIRILHKIPKSDACVLIAVSVITVLVDLAVAVLAGVLLSAIMFAWQQGKSMHAKVEATEDGKRLYRLKGILFFGSVASFKSLFDFENDPTDVGLDFSEAKVWDHSALDAIHYVAHQYQKKGKTLHLFHVSEDCYRLLQKAEIMVLASIASDSKEMIWHQRLADDRLG